MSARERVRYMRLILFFDLPVLTSKQRRDYRVFRKFSLKDGFLQLQESVYAKLVLNDGLAAASVNRVKKNRPPEGLVQILKVTEGQFSTMEFITGERADYDEVDSTEELLVL